MAQLPRKSAKKLRMRVAGVVSHRRHPRQSALGLAEKGITLVQTPEPTRPIPDLSAYAPKMRDVPVDVENAR